MTFTVVAIALAAVVITLASLWLRAMLSAAERTVGCGIDKLNASLHHIAQRSREWWFEVFGTIRVGPALCDLLVVAGASVLLWADFHLLDTTLQAPIFGFPTKVAKATAFALVLAHALSGLLVFEAIRERPIVQLLEELSPRARHRFVVMVITTFVVAALVAGAIAGIRAYLGFLGSSQTGYSQPPVIVYTAIAIMSLLSVIVAVLGAVAGSVLPRTAVNVTALTSGLAVLVILIVSWAVACFAMVWQWLWRLIFLTMAIPLALRQWVSSVCRTLRSRPKHGQDGDSTSADGDDGDEESDNRSGPR